MPAGRGRAADVSEFQWTSQNLHAWDKATNHMLRQDPELNAWRRPQTHDQGRPQHVIGPSPYTHREHYLSKVDVTLQVMGAFFQHLIYY